jgi:anti-sigma factor RsiW
MDDRELLIRYRDGDLSDEELAGVEERLKSEPDLRSRRESLEEIATLLERGAASSFEPFFATRVVARLRQTESSAPVEGMYEALRWIFARVAVACLVVMLAIGAYSALEGGYGGSVVDSVMGLPEATLETALALGG